MAANKCIFISGTSKGLGRQLLVEYIKLGYTVIGCSRSAATLTHDKYFHYQMDISNDLDVKRTFSDIRSKKLVPNIFVNNAGIEISNIIALTKLKDAESVVNINLLGSFLMLRETHKLMQRNSYGRIINLSSICVPLGTPGAAIYNASKAGIEAFSFTLANESKAFDITVNTIGLSFVEDTGMTNARSDKTVLYAQKRMLKPSFLKITEIVNAINFFGAREAKNITGQTLFFGGVR